MSSNVQEPARSTVRSRPPAGPSAARVDRFADLHKVPESVADFEPRLQAWAAWNRGDGGGGNTSSLWRQYKAPSAYDRPTGIRPPQIITADALAVERAVRQVPEQHRAVLRLYYVANVHPGRICAEAALHPGALKRFLDDARCMAHANWKRESPSALSKRPSALYPG